VKVYNVAVLRLNHEIVELEKDLGALRFWQFRKRQVVQRKLYRARHCLDALKSEFHCLESQPDEYQLLLLTEYNEYSHGSVVSSLTT
jgi:hypothetical protein